MLPLPLLFPWRSVSDERRADPVNLIRRAINEILMSTGIADATGQRCGSN